jgi:hypothetical protein
MAGHITHNNLLMEGATFQEQKIEEIVDFTATY